MTPNEIYAIPADYTTKSWYNFWNFIPDFLLPEPGYAIQDDAQTRIETRVLRGVGSYTLNTVWFDEKPVMIVATTRSDGSKCHITDRERFYDLISHVNKTVAERLKSRDNDYLDLEPTASDDAFRRTIEDWFTREEIEKFQGKDPEQPASSGPTPR